MGALVGLLFGLGVCAALPVVFTPNRRLTERISPALGVVAETPWSVAFWHQRLVPHLNRTLTGQAHAARLRQAGIDADPLRHRIGQLTIGVAAGFAVLCWFGLMSLTGRAMSPTRMLVVSVVVGLVAVAITEVRVLSAVARRRRQKFVDLADIADLLALSVTAGEPLAVALASVSEVSKGPLAREIAQALEMGLGQQSSSTVLRRLRNDADVLAVQRFFSGLVAAVERGTPIAEILRAQAADVRAALARELMESAGRREIAMLAPVVFLILPCVVAIALYPGFIAIKGVM